MNAELTERGKVTWHCSEEDGGPDVGISIGLGDGRMLWVGEISRPAFDAAGQEAALLGELGWWIILYNPERVIIGKALDWEAADKMIEALAVAFARVNQ